MVGLTLLPVEWPVHSIRHALLHAAAWLMAAADIAYVAAPRRQLQFSEAQRQRRCVGRLIAC